MTPTADPLDAPEVSSSQDEVGSGAERLRRGPHAQRRELTRARAFAAAIENLYEFGYAGSSLASVARRAGCSRGALLKQFSTKAGLYAGLAEKLLDDMRADNLAYVRSFPRGIRRAMARFDHTWDLYTGQSALAVLEVLLGSRADPALSRMLEPVGRARYAVERQLFELDFEDMGIKESREAYVATFQMLATIRGLAIERLLGADEGLLRDAFVRQRDELEETFKRMMTEGGA